MPPLHLRPVTLALALALSACAPKAPPIASTLAPAAPPSHALSIQDLMISIVDPAADALWEAVSSETTASGSVEHQPQTAAQWQAVRQHALRLIEAAQLLGIEGRPVAHAGKTLEDAHVAGIWGAADIEQEIASTASTFKARAAELGESAQAALVAIDARDPARLLVAGGRIDQACERCHMVYWYPNVAQPPAKWPAALKGN